ncbi:bestrophin family protein [Algoriphagus algorifonticola]|uniref:bestrophin family protein n=1 Tax=Algoriphagus algorifonticola TaxID=2593007 RepID=UPI0011A9902A|nr:bestrophin family ion channel [Algoriphagus algorifonticola]
MLLNTRISVPDFIKTIKLDIILITSYAITVGVLDQYSLLSKISVPLGITAVFGTAVSLLLAFRTSQSYERWWEARIIWGAIVNDSRTLIRQAISFYDKDHEQYMVKTKEIAQRQIMWCYALGESLRRIPFSARVKTYIDAHSDQMNAQNVPNAILLEHSRALADARENSMIDPFQHVQMDATVARLCDSMGKCERIKNTVFPKAYSLLIHTIIYVFATLLPFGLSDEYLLVEIAITIGIPIVFIAIEKTSILMQDPFENKPMDIPMTDLAQTIEINIRQMIDDREIPEKVNPSTYYIL